MISIKQLTKPNKKKANITITDQSVSIITVTYNAKEFVKEYVKTIFSGSTKPQEVLIYDGGSTDGTVEQIKKYQKLYKEIKLFEGEDIGFAAGNNLLAKKARSHFLFILSPDTKIDRHCISNLLANPHREKSILMPKRYLFDGTFLHHGMGLDIFGFPADGKIFFVDGAAIFLKRKLFINLGMFDDDYFMFQEDVDLSWRAQLDGVSLITADDAFLFHYSGGSTPSGGIKKNINDYTTNTFKRYLGERNTLQNILKNYSSSFLLIILPLVILSNLFEIIFFTITLNFKFVGCYLRAYYWVIFHLGSILKKRKIVQANRKVNDLKIISKMSLISSKLKYFFKFGIPKIR